MGIGLEAFLIYYSCVGECRGKRTILDPQGIVCLARHVCYEK